MKTGGRWYRTAQIDLGATMREFGRIAAHLVPMDNDETVEQMVRRLGLFNPVNPFGRIAGYVKRGPSGGVLMPPIKPQKDELFYFGVTVEKFAIHKAARVIGLCERPGPAGGYIKCFRLQYPDGEIAHGEFAEESQGAFELLNYDDGIAKHGEEAFT